MVNDSNNQDLTAAYRVLAEKLVARHAEAMAAEFPDERFPVRPAYRKAMYHRLTCLVDDLNSGLGELLDASPDEALRQQLMDLQEGFEQDFIQQVRKEDPRQIIKA